MRILMATPEHFQVAYAINPHMKTSSGELNRVDRAKAQQQWDALATVYRKLGFTVETLPGHPELPDMVFTANQSFPFTDGDGARAVVMSRMKSDFRKPEVAYFRRWYESQGYRVLELREGVFFEGNGDALLHPNRGVIWGASGPRTSPEVYDELERLTGYNVMRITLTTEDFYHLDTCFSILDERTVAIYPHAFDKASLARIRGGFQRVIEIDRDENLRFFAGNCHCPDGKHVILQKGSKSFTSKLAQEGFEPIEVDTSEFLKSGGSVFCMKMVVL